MAWVSFLSWPHCSENFFGREREQQSLLMCRHCWIAGGASIGLTLLWPWESGQPEWPCCGHGKVASLSDPAASWQCHVGWPLRNGFLYKSETTTNKTSLGLKGEGWFLGWIKVGFALYGNNPLPLCAACHWWVSQLFMEGLSTVTSPCCAPCSVK